MKKNLFHTRRKTKFGVGAALSMFLVLVLMAGAATPLGGSAVFAASDSEGESLYVFAAEDDVRYIDADGVMQTVNGVTVADQAWFDASGPTMSAGWYIARGTITHSSTLNIPQGAVYLILEDDCDLTVNGSDAGISVTGYGSLSIYSQSTDAATMGKLTATGMLDGAGIGVGASGSAGRITINGGFVEATGGYNAPGIGGGTDWSTSGNIIINGGKIVATGGPGVAGIRLLPDSPGGNILIRGENTEVNVSGGEIQGSNVFAILPEGKLKSGASNLGNTVVFSANPESANTVSMNLPEPFRSYPFVIGGYYPITVGLGNGGNEKAFSVYTTYSDYLWTIIKFSLPGLYSLWRTGADLKAPGAIVAFTDIPPTYTIQDAAGDRKTTYSWSQWISDQKDYNIPNLLEGAIVNITATGSPSGTNIAYIDFGGSAGTVKSVAGKYYSNICLRGNHLTLEDLRIEYSTNNVNGIVELYGSDPGITVIGDCLIKNSLNNNEYSRAIKQSDGGQLTIDGPGKLSAEGGRSGIETNASAITIDTDVAARGTAASPNYAAGIMWSGAFGPASMDGSGSLKATASANKGVGLSSGISELVFGGTLAIELEGAYYGAGLDIGTTSGTQRIVFDRSVPTTIIAGRNGAALRKNSDNNNLSIANNGFGTVTFDGRIQGAGILVQGAVLALEGTGEIIAIGGEPQGAAGSQGIKFEGSGAHSLSIGAGANAIVKSPNYYAPIGLAADNTFSSVEMADEAQINMTSGTNTAYAFTKNPLAGQNWRLLNASLGAGQSLSDNNINVSINANSTVTIARRALSQIVIGQGDTVTGIQTAIQESLAANNTTVTVSGSKTNADGTLEIDIPSGKTLLWKAVYAADEAFDGPLIETTGAGVFELADGGLRSSSGIAASIASGSGIHVTGGTVGTEGGVGISGGNVRLSGGVVSAGSGIAVETHNSAIFIDGGAATINGDVRMYADMLPEDPVGIYCRSGGKVTVNGNVSIEGTNIAGIWCEDGIVAANGNVSVTGTGDCEYIEGVYCADGGKVNMKGSLDVRLAGPYEASWYLTGIDCRSGGQVALNGDVYIEGPATGIKTADGGTVSVDGNVYASGDNSTGVSVGDGGKANVSRNITADGADSKGLVVFNGSEAAVGQSVSAGGTGSVGVYAMDGGKALVGQNVNAEGAGCYGVEVSNGSEATIDGLVGATADRYIRINGAFFAPWEYEAVTTKQGYRSFNDTDSGGVSSVWVRDIGDVFAIDPGYLMLVSDGGPQSSAALTAHINGSPVTGTDWEWSSSNPEVAKIATAGNSPEETIEAVGPGSCYITAGVQVGPDSNTASIFVDVTGTAIPEDKRIDKAHLRMTTVTVGTLSQKGVEVGLVYETKGDMLAALGMTLREPVTLDGYDIRLLAVKKDNKGNDVPLSVKTENEIRGFLKFEMLDDRTIGIVRNPACTNFKPAKSSYKFRIELNDGSNRITIPEALTVKMDKKAPSIKVGAHKFNTFIDGHTIPLKLSSPKGRVSSVSLNGSKSHSLVNDGIIALNANEMSLALDTGGYNSLTKKPKAGSVKVALLVRVEGYDPVPASVKISFGKTLPGLKLSAKSTVFMGAGANGQPAGFSQGVPMKLLPKNKKNSLSGLGVEGLTVDDDIYEITGFNAATGDFLVTLKAAKNPASKTLSLRAAISGTGQTVPLALKISVLGNKAAPSVKVSPGTVTLNNTLGYTTVSGTELGNDVARVRLNAKPADLDLTPGSLDIGILRGTAPATGELDVQPAPDGRSLEVRTIDGETRFGATYTVTLTAREQFGSPAKNPKASFKVKIPAADSKSDVTATLAVSGKLDSSNPAGTIKVTPKFKNCSLTIDDGSLFSFTATDRKGKPIPGAVPDAWFSCDSNGDGSFTVGFDPEAWRTGKVKPGYKYSIRLAKGGTGEGGVPTGVYISGKPLAKAASKGFSVTQPKLKLGQSVKTVTLYKNSYHSSEIVAMSAKGEMLPDKAKVVLDSASAKKFSLRPLGNGQYSIEFKPGTTPKSASVKAKLKVYLPGNYVPDTLSPEGYSALGAKANATATVKVVVK